VRGVVGADALGLLGRRPALVEIRSVVGVIPMIGKNGDVST
jgi:hypothetical protein